MEKGREGILFDRRTTTVNGDETMTVLLILFTLILFLLADHFVQKARLARARQLAGETLESIVMSSVRLPEGTSVALNHTWLREEDRGIITIGIDEFISRLVGAVEDIALPQNGAVIAPSFSSITLRDGMRQLEMASPVSGRVVEVNEKVIRNPALARKDPYGDGWLVKIRPDRANSVRTFTKAGEDAILWLRAQGDRAKQFFVEHAPQPALATMYDGGTPAEGVLKHFDADVWREFQTMFADMRPN
jgi:glycine cleavage system H protein